MSKKNPKTAREFIRLAQRDPEAEVSEGSRHTKVRKGNRVVTIPRHNGDLATGTCRSIAKAFRLMGLLATIIVIAIALSYLSSLVPMVF